MSELKLWKVNIKEKTIKDKIVSTEDIKHNLYDKLRQYQFFLSCRINNFLKKKKINKTKEKKVKFTF